MQACKQGFLSLLLWATAPPTCPDWQNTTEEGNKPSKVSHITMACEVCMTGILSPVPVCTGFPTAGGGLWGLNGAFVIKRRQLYFYTLRDSPRGFRQKLGFYDDWNSFLLWSVVAWAHVVVPWWQSSDRRMLRRQHRDNRLIGGSVFPLPPSDC